MSPNRIIFAKVGPKIYKMNPKKLPNIFKLFAKGVNIALSVTLEATIALLPTASNYASPHSCTYARWVLATLSWYNEADAFQPSL